MALPAGWCHDPVKSRAVPVYGVCNAPTDDTVIAERTTTSASPTDATEICTVYTRKNASPTPMTARSLTPDVNGVPTWPRKSVQFAVLEATVILDAYLNFWAPHNKRCFARKRSTTATSLIKRPQTDHAHCPVPKLKPDRLVCLLSSSICIVRGYYKTRACAIVPPSITYDTCSAYGVIARLSHPPSYREYLIPDAPLPRLAIASEKPPQQSGFVKLWMQLGSAAFEHRRLSLGAWQFPWFCTLQMPADTSASIKVRLKNWRLQKTRVSPLLGRCQAGYRPTHDPPKTKKLGTVPF